jgi:hypothetical protein
MIMAKQQTDWLFLVIKDKYRSETEKESSTGQIDLSRAECELLRNVSSRVEFDSKDSTFKNFFHNSIICFSVLAMFIVSRVGMRQWEFISMNSLGKGLKWIDSDELTILNKLQWTIYNSLHSIQCVIKHSRCLNYPIFDYIQNIGIDEIDYSFLPIGPFRIVLRHLWEEEIGLQYFRSRARKWFRTIQDANSKLWDRVENS